MNYPDEIEKKFKSSNIYGNNYYQIFIYSIENLSLLYHLKDLFEIKDYFSSINDIALLNNQKELIIVRLYLI